MQATVHAALLILLPVSAVMFVLLLRRRNPTSRQVLIALAIAALGTVAAPVFNHHLCREGEPRNQWLILGPCLFLILLAVDSKAWRRTLAGCVFVGMMGLSCHFTEMVHTPGWTGNPDWDGGQRAILQSMQRSAAAVTLDIENEAVALPEGWLRDSAIWSRVKDIFGDQHPVRREFERAWHTPLTGLYPYRPVEQDFWYPGGPLRDAIERIELRDRALSP